MTPGFDVTGDQVNGIGDASDAASLLYTGDVLTEQPLSPARLDERLAHGRRQPGLLEAAQFVALPVLTFGFLCRRDEQAPLVPKLERIASSGYQRPEEFTQL